jgi:hypothetical protein
MVDSGAMASFIDVSFAQSLKLPLTPKSSPVNVVAFNGHPSGTIHFECSLTLCVGHHSEIITFDVTTLGHFPIILGMPWLKLHDPSLVWSKRQLFFNSDYCLSHCLCSNTSSNTQDLIELPLVPVSSASADSVPIIHSASTDPKLKAAIPLSSLVPTCFHDLLDAFSKDKSNTLPPHGPYDHHIPLIEGESPPFGPLYPMSRRELEVLREYLTENLANNFIRPSTSPAGDASALFVPKMDDTLRPCIDYRGLNKVTVKNRYPLPLINDLLDRLLSARIFTKLDIRNAYNHVRIAKGDEWKTAFRTHYGHFEYLVMPFGPTNAPASFQNLINNTLRDFLDIFVVVYLDDVLIFSSNMEEHQNHVRLVLQRLLKAGLFVKAEKCEFHQEKVEFLGFCISTSGISMDPKKVSAIME